jgi:hypothetical protein
MHAGEISITSLVVKIKEKQDKINNTSEQSRNRNRIIGKSEVCTVRSTIILKVLFLRRKCWQR